MLLFVLGVLPGIAVAVWMLLSHLEKSAAAKESMKHAAALLDDTLEDRPIAPDGNSAIALDHAAGLLHLVTPHRDVFALRKFRAAEIVEASILQDDVEVVTTRRQGVIGRAVVGGVLLGGVGALAGAATAGSSSTAVSLVKKLTIRLVISDASDPLVLVGFLPHNGRYRHSAEFKAAELTADRWLAKIKVLLNPPPSP